MSKKKVKREGIMVGVAFVLVVITIGTATYLTGILSRNLNRFLSAGDTQGASGIIKFNFEAYSDLGL